MVWPDDLLEWEPAHIIQIPPNLLETALDTNPRKHKAAVPKKEKPKKASDHEAGLFRISCDCPPTPSSEREETHTVYVSGLSPDTTEALVQSSFANCGEVRDIELVADVRLPRADQDGDATRTPLKRERVMDGLESHLKALEGLLVDEDGQEISAFRRANQNLTSEEELQTHLQEPRRVGLDGSVYPKSIFLQMYGEEAWREAPRDKEDEVRQAEDGEFYTKAEFEQHQVGLEAWVAAAPEQDLTYRERFARPVKANKNSIGAFVSFQNEDGYQKAVSAPLRMLGVAINDRICYPQQPFKQRTLVIGWTDEFLSGHDAATEVKLMLRPYLGEVEVERVRGGKISCLYCFLTFSSFPNASAAKAAITEAICQNEKYNDLRVGWALKYPRAGKQRKRKLYE